MKLCLDARKWTDGGIGVFIRLLAEQLTKNGVEVIAIARSNQKDAIEAVTHQPVYVSDAANYSVSELIEVGSVANKTNADLFYAPHYVIPFGLKMPIVSLVHDTIQMEFPDQFSFIQRSYARYMIGRALRISQRVITQSKTVRQDLLKTFPKTPTEKIEAVRMVFDPNWISSPNTDLFPAVQQPYCIYFGAYRKHKNLAFLAELWNKHPSLPPLVLVGDDIQRYPELANQVKQLLNDGRWHDAGEVPFSDLLRWVKHAFVGLFPSKYEGYGQPPLEAMACGVPVVVSNCGAIPEISGEGAVTIPVDNTELWYNEIEELSKQQYYEQRKEKGLAWVRQFSVQVWIDKHIQICRESAGIRR